MANYKKVDNCGPVPYPDQSGRHLGAGEVASDDADNDWAPLVALGFVVETGGAVTPDRQEAPAEMAKAVVLVPEPPAAEEPAPKSKKRSKKKSKKEEGVSDGGSADDSTGGEEVDSSSPWKSDS
jgi:hypothetical protein